MAINPATTAWPIVGGARTPVVPVNGAFKALSPHALAAPVLQQLLQQSGVPAHAVNGVVIGNALAAGGNPARLLALAAGLPESVPAVTVDTQCCSGLDAITLACGWLALGHADIIVAGGVEAWSRAPLRMHRPLHANLPAQAYAQPAFSPWPERDPDMLDAAAAVAQRMEISRAEQNRYAIASHERALSHAAQLMQEIVPIAGITQDVYPRSLQAQRVARMPVVRGIHSAAHIDCSLQAVAISAQADGAALVLLASPQACKRWNLQPKAAWLGASNLGAAPEAPLLCAHIATEHLLQRHALSAQALSNVELHDAFAVQGVLFARALGLRSEQLNPAGGGLARGHPIGASAAIAFVRALATWSYSATAEQPYAMACAAGAGGLGTAALIGPWLP